MNSLFKILPIVFILFLFQSCVNKDDDLPTDPPPGNNVQTIPTYEDILNGTDETLKTLLNTVRGSVGKRGPGSKVIWSTKNDYGLGLYVSAHHAVGVDAFPNRTKQFLDLLTESENWGIYTSSQLPPINGAIALGDTLIADYMFYHPTIAASTTNTNIPPAEDFYLGIIDNKRVEDNGLGQSPFAIQLTTPLSLYDPNNRTTASQTWSTPIAGENALAIGYPQDNITYPNGAAAYGKILSDTEAEDIIAQLKAADDTEGDIPYNASVEFFVATEGLPGMSGGGVFNNEGALLGIIVRGSETDNVTKIIRVVRMDYIRTSMIDYYNLLAPTEKEKVAGFINGEL